MSHAREIVELLEDAPCSFRMCNRPKTVHACRSQVTCSICWARCYAQIDAKKEENP